MEIQENDAENIIVRTRVSEYTTSLEEQVRMNHKKKEETAIKPKLNKKE